MVCFLLLGDGDFTYSLDLARYLAHDTNHGEKSYRLIATGIDSRDQLVAKYKDTPFVLKQLESTSSNTLISVTVYHGVNAIITGSPSNETKATVLQEKADHVMFHHPHIGTEDSSLHGRFLSHLFYSVANHWMKQDGVFHLSLVFGQCERWNCLEAADRHGLKLLGRKAFFPPPAVQQQKAYYHYRRHQTGKSFESRRPQNQSETLTFGRSCDSSLIAKCLPWQQQQPQQQKTDVPATVKGEDDDSSSNKLDCPYCDKKFKEERSRKCHIRDKHPYGPNKKSKKTNNDDDAVNEFLCYQCQTENDPPRTFSSEQALHDHVQAKHSAIHKIILPDWSKQQQKESKEEVSLALLDFGSCDICNLKYQSEEQKLDHFNDFIPKESTPSFHCQFCNKTFRERRANQQHENFCSKRIKIGGIGQ